MTTIGPVTSPVDYDAWLKGYMPPTEHIVIDQLSFRGAKVIAGSDQGDRAWWLVIKGPLDKKTRQAIQPALKLLFEMLDEDDAAPQPPIEEGVADLVASDGEGSNGREATGGRPNPESPTPLEKKP